ncbi:alpha/beta hydrolase [Streptomyces canus]|uniref:alpha/beta fold hydrolase n=1 Tax=Streptomyces canus TaxID=58343 RepID=UPI002E36991C|nr:alpha/beta hydrolase [Streptomyces canus]
MFDPARHVEAYAAEQAAITAVGERPILFLHGTDDGSIGSDVIHNPKDHLPQGSRVERIDDAATFSNLEQPERIKREVLAWLAG